MSKKRKIKCLWYKDHREGFTSCYDTYSKEDYVFSICPMCRMKARLGMPTYKAPRPKKKRRIRKKK